MELTLTEIIEQYKLDRQDACSMTFEELRALERIELEISYREAAETWHAWKYDKQVMEFRKVGLA